MCASGIQTEGRFTQGVALLYRIVGKRLVRGYAISANSTIGSQKEGRRRFRETEAAVSGPSDQIWLVRSWHAQKLDRRPKMNLRERPAPEPWRRVHPRLCGQQMIRSRFGQRVRPCRPWPR